MEGISTTYERITVSRIISRLLLYIILTTLVSSCVDARDCTELITRLGDTGSERFECDADGQIVLARLVGLNFTYQDIRCIGYMAHLHTLILEDTNIRDRDLEYFEHLTALETLDLDNTTITESGLKHLRHLPKLQGLSLAHTQIQNNSIQVLADFRMLVAIDLSYNKQITDECVIYLLRMPRLSLINLYDTSITESGIKTLQAADIAVNR